MIDLDDTMQGSTMTVREAITRARRWWNDKGGRHALSHQLNESSNQERIGRRFTPGNGKSPGILIPGNKQPVLNSGILRGLQWDDLDNREKMALVHEWHKHHIAKHETVQ